MAISTNFSEAKLRKAAAGLTEKAAAEQLASDPQKFMARFGIDIDEETATAIRNRLAGEQFSTRPSSILHVDMA